MLQDQEFIERIKSEIETEKINAEWAVENVTRYYASLFLNMENEYMRERAQDIKDIGNRIKNSLKGLSKNPSDKNAMEGIIAAKEITPSYMAQLNTEKITGVLTETGGKTSHAAIISRALGIPAVTGIQALLEEVQNGDYIVFDGESGNVYINPSDEILRDYKEKLKDLISKKQTELFERNKKYHLTAARLRFSQIFLLIRT